MALRRARTRRLVIAGGMFGSWRSQRPPSRGESWRGTVCFPSVARSSLMVAVRRGELFNTNSVGLGQFGSLPLVTWGFDLVGPEGPSSVVDLGGR